MSSGHFVARTVIPFYHDDLSVYQYLILSYMEMGQFGKSIDLCYEKINKNPEDYSVYITLGRILIRIEKYTEGLEVFEKAISQKPDYSAAYYGKSLCLARLGKVNEVFTALRLAIVFDSELLLTIRNEPSFEPILQSESFKSFVLEIVCGNEEEHIYH